MAGPAGVDRTGGVSGIAVRPATAADTAWILTQLDEEWGGPVMWADGRAFDCRALPTLIAEPHSGFAIYEVAGERAELVLLEAMRLGRGIGTALVEALAELLEGQGVREMWLTTTNDSLDALRFYQRRGFRLVEVGRGRMDEYRARKPTIPVAGEFGIALQDELRLVREISARMEPPRLAKASLTQHYRRGNYSRSDWIR